MSSKMKDQPMADTLQATLSSTLSAPPSNIQNIEIQKMTDRSVYAAQKPEASLLGNPNDSSPRAFLGVPTVTPKTVSVAKQNEPQFATATNNPNNLDSLVSNIFSPTTINYSSNPTMANVALPMTEEPRRSGRERTSTLIYVDGHAIKKDNNYVMKGLTYEYGVVKGDEHPPPLPRRQPQQPKQPSQPRATPTISPAEMERRRLKQSIASRVQAKQAQRQQFLKQNIQILEPFLEPKVIEKILAFPDTLHVDTAPPTYLQPDAIKADMRDYQLKGLHWMSHMYSKNLGFILGDEMGLGKTLQTISLVCHLREQFGVTKGPSLIVCPLSVLNSWCNEIKKWSNLKYIQLHLPSADKMEIPELGGYDMVVTTYEMCKVPALNRLWSRQHFNLMVLDEGHRIKGIESQQSLAVRKIHSENRVILTGTPLANNLVELFALLNFLLPDVFTTVEPFAEAYDLTNNVVDRAMLDKANKVLNLFMIRRLKTLVEKDMPPKVETKVICPLSNTQIWWYKAILLKDLSLLTGDKTKKSGALNNLIMQLRKCVNHPYLMPFAEDKDHEASLTELIGESGKLSVLDMLLRSLYQKGHRVCLFSQFTRVLDILDDYCKLRGWNFCRFDGGTPRAERNFTVNSFNEPGSKKFIFLMSTRSGGMGINLQQGADTVILFDSDWNPQHDVQAMARVHRIGQKKITQVFRLVTANTVEERIAERAEKKLFMATRIMQDGSSHGSHNADETEDAGQLMDALRFGCNAVFGDKGQQDMKLPTEEDIDMLTDRNRSQDFTGGKIKGGTECNTDDFDATKKFTSTTDFGGIDFRKLRQDYQKKRKPKDMGNICDLWRQKRQRKSRITLVAGEGSGYGAKAVPVLKANDYELETGERSVFQQELGGRTGNFKNVGKRHLKAGVDYEWQDTCQVCGDGGSLLCCPRCPVAIHQECSGCTEKNFQSCSHHACSVCQKNNSASGGFMFRCSCCPLAFCEEHVPGNAIMLDRCERMEKLGYTIKNGIYVLCSSVCENVAKQEYGWIPESECSKVPCPPALNLSEFYGGTVDDCLDTPKELILSTKRRRKQPTKYGDFVTDKENNSVASVKPHSTTGAASSKPFTLSSSSVSNSANTVSASSSGEAETFSIASAPSVDSIYSSSSDTPSSDEELVTTSSPRAPAVARAYPKPTALLNADKARTHLRPTGLLNASKGEYATVLPIIGGSIRINIGEVGKNVVFLGYKNHDNGTKCLAEYRQAIRNRFDRIIGINGFCVRGKSLNEVVKLVVTIKNQGAKAIKLDMQEVHAYRREEAMMNYLH